jgi:CARDB
MLLSRILLFLFICSSAFAAADLEIKTIKGQPGKEFSLEFMFMNHGPDPANNVGCNVYFYATERLVLSQAFKLASIGSGASRKEQLTMEFPNQAITTVKVEIFDSEQPDVQPSTNFMQMNIKPPDLRKADLQIIKVELVEQREKGKNILLATLRNNGPDKIGPSKLNVSLEVYGQALAQSEKRIERMDAGAELETRLQIPNAPLVPATNGSIVLRWSGDDVEEVEARNNLYKFDVPLTLRMPDLQPLKAAIDKQGVLTFSVNNKGNARAEDSVTALYINGALVERYNTPDMAPRGLRQYRYNAKKLTAEDKVVIVVDFNADVQESSEENNRTP